MIQDPQDPLAGYSPDWRSRRAGGVSPQEPDLLEGYTPDWRERAGAIEPLDAPLPAAPLAPPVESVGPGRSWGDEAVGPTALRPPPPAPTVSVGPGRSWGEPLAPIPEVLGPGTVRRSPAGYDVYDSTRRDPDGRVPTHRVDQIAGRVGGQAGLTVEQLEEQVLARPRSGFTADTVRVSDVNALQPEVRSAVSALMEEAQRAGLRVTVGETARSQERQDWLFQSGRSRPGPIVTWTLTSNHTPGRAVDFIINGDSTGADPGYLWLQENASRFGLSVLGPQDIGHLDMPLVGQAREPLQPPPLQPAIAAANERLARAAPRYGQAPDSLGESPYLRSPEMVVGPPLAATPTIAPPTDTPPLETPSQFMRGLRTGFESTRTGLGETLETVGGLTGAEGLEARGEAFSEQARAAQEAHPGRVTDVREIKDLRDFRDWASFSLGQGLASTAAPVIGGLAGGAAAGPVGAAVGAMAPSYGLMLGEIRSELEGAGIDPATIDRVAPIVAVPAAALEALLPGKIGSSAAAGAAARFGRELAKRIVAGAARGALTEGITEAGQDLIAKGTVAGLSPEHDLMTRENMWSLVNSALAGALPGGAFGSLGAVTEGRMAPAEVAPKEELEQAPAAIAQVEQAPTIAPPRTELPPPTGLSPLEQAMADIEQARAEVDAARPALEEERRKLQEAGFLPTPTEQPAPAAEERLAAPDPVPPRPDPVRDELQPPAAKPTPELREPAQQKPAYPRPKNVSEAIHREFTELYTGDDDPLIAANSIADYADFRARGATADDAMRRVLAYEDPGTYTENLVPPRPEVVPDEVAAPAAKPAADLPLPGRGERAPDEGEEAHTFWSQAYLEGRWQVFPHATAAEAKKSAKDLLQRGAKQSGWSSTRSTASQQLAELEANAPKVTFEKADIVPGRGGVEAIPHAPQGAPAHAPEPEAPTSQLPGGLTLIETPNGRWAFRGKVPNRLAFERKDGKPITPEEVERIKQFGMVGNMKDVYRSRSWASREEAVAAAQEGAPAPTKGTEPTKPTEPSPAPRDLAKEGVTVISWKKGTFAVYSSLLEGNLAQDFKTRAEAEEWRLSYGRGGAPAPAQPTKAAAPQAPPTPAAAEQPAKPARKRKVGKNEESVGGWVLPRGRRSSVQDPAALAAYFTPGEIVEAYAGARDRVISFTPGDAGRNWSVVVRRVDREGNFVADEENRGHYTLPYRSDFEKVMRERGQWPGTEAPKAEAPKPAPAPKAEPAPAPPSGPPSKFAPRKVWAVIRRGDRAEIQSMYDEAVRDYRVLVETTDYSQQRADRTEDAAYDLGESLGLVEADVDKALGVPTRSTEPPPAKPYGADNKVVTPEEYAKLQAELREMLKRTNTIDPNIMRVGAKVAAFHIEAGARRFMDLALKLSEQLGMSLRALRPYLRVWYNGARAVLENAGADVSDMDDAEAVRDALADIDALPEQELAQPPADTKVEEEATDEARDGGGAPERVGPEVQEQPAREPAGPVSRDEPGRDAGAARPGGRRTGERDVPVDGEVDGGESGTLEGDSLPGSGERDRTDMEDGEGGRGPRVDSGSRQGDSEGDGTGRLRVEHDYRITEADELGAGSEKQRVARNMAAIRLMLQIEREGRPATPEEQKVLVRYVAWGGLKRVFTTRASDTEFVAARRELEEILTPAEFKRVRATVKNSHFTSPPVIAGIYSALKRMGFQGGRVIEPALGVGHFIGLRPEWLNARWTGVEIDPVTARIAKLLYPSADIHISPVERAKLPKGAADVVLSNVPFGGYGVSDSTFKAAQKFLLERIHDYYFAKALQLVRPGGIVAFITSDGTLDKKSAAVREYIAKNADFLGAVRLPHDTFKKFAGADVTTDIIFLRRREEGAAPSHVADFTKVVEKADAEGRPYDINEYYVEHPEQVLGEVRLRAGRYGAELEAHVFARPGQDLDVELARAIGNLPENSYVPRAVEIEEPSPGPLGGRATDVPANSFVEIKGVIYQSVDGKLQKPARLGERQVGAQADRVRRLIRLRDLRRQVLLTQESQAPEAAREKARAALNREYDAFVAKHGPINRETWFVSKSKDKTTGVVTETPYARRLNIEPFATDPEAPHVSALEHFDPESGEASKRDIFARDVIGPKEEVASAETALEALPHVLARTGRVDLTAIAAMVGVDEASAREQLRGAVFENPETGKLETADEYLSGNVRRKLAVARNLASRQPQYEENVSALEGAQPEDVRPAEITAGMGTPWIPVSDYQQFASDILGVEVAITWNAAQGKWQVDLVRGDPQSPRLLAEWGIETPHAHTRADGLTLFEKSINMASHIVYRPHPERPAPARQRSPTHTVDAQAKQQEMKQRFKEWVWEDPTRRDRLARFYNDNFNNIRSRGYTAPPGYQLRGAVATMGGRPFSLRPWQLDGVWRVLQEPATLLAWVVGSGKTYTMAASAMEARRLGLAKKPVITVPNHMLSQFSNEMLAMYPRAKVLVADAVNFDAKRRRQFVANMAAGDWDAVIMTHSSFEMLGVSQEARGRFVQKEIDELTREMEERSRQRGADRNYIRELEEAIAELEGRLHDIMAEDKKDDLLDFEQTGVDMLIVDEAHMYKNLYTRSRIQGMAKRGAERSLDLYLKTAHMHDIGGKVVFSTGTPITNSMSEAFTMQRYLQPSALEDRGLERFDAWAAQFGEVMPSVEMDVAAKNYRVVDRFANFINMVELGRMFRQVADVIRPDDLTDESGTPLLDIPPLIGGKKEEPDITPATPALEAYIDALNDRLDRVRQGKVDPTEDNALNIATDGRHAALDMRLVDASAPDAPNSKTNRAVANILKKWEETKEHRGAQLVFLNISTPSSATEPSTRGGLDFFSVYDDIRDKLIAKGVPAEEIAFMQDAAGSDRKKALLLDKVRNGQVRVLLGSTEVMGAGTNVQARLVALHHLDVPWVPADLEQREGRILRQGNLLWEQRKIPGVAIYRYAADKSFDVFMWQTVERKARFIEQFMKGDETLRVMEDLSAAVEDAESMKAVLSGNPLAMEEVGLRREIDSLERAARAHTESQGELRARIGQLPKAIREAELGLKDVERDVEALVPTQGDSFRIELGGQEFTKRADVYDNLRGLVLDAYRDFKAAGTGNELQRVVGKFAGLELVVRATGGKNIHLWVGLRGPSKETWVSEVDLASSGQGFLATLEHVPGQMRSLVDVRRGEISRLEKQLEEARALVGGPFKHQALLDEKRRRWAVIQRLQRGGGGSNPWIEVDGDERTAEGDPEGAVDDALRLVDTPAALDALWSTIQQKLGSTYKDLVDATAIRVGDMRTRMEQGLPPIPPKIEPSSPPPSAPGRAARLERARAEYVSPRKRRAAERRDYLDRIAQDARDRIVARHTGTTLQTLGTADLHDYAIIGAVKVLKGARRAKQWSDEMVAQFGAKIKPHLADIRRLALRLARNDKQALAVLPDAKRAVVERALDTWHQTPEQRAARAQRRREARDGLFRRRLRLESLAERVGAHRELSPELKARAEKVVERALAPKNAQETMAQVRAAKTPREARNAIRRAQRIISAALHKKAVGELKSQLRRVKYKGKVRRLRPEFEKGLATLMKPYIAKRELDGSALAKLDAEEVLDLADRVAELIHMSRTINTMIGQHRRETRDQLSEQAIEEMEERVKPLNRGKWRDLETKPKRNWLGVFLKEFATRPEVLIEHMSPTLRKLIWEDIVVDAHAQEQRTVWKFRDALADAVEKAGLELKTKEFETWRNKGLKWETPQGTVQVTNDEAILLLGALRDPHNRARASREGITVGRSDRLVRIDDDAVAALQEIAPQADKIAGALFRQFNGAMKQALNEAWVKVYGYEIARVPSYWPSQIDVTRADLHKDPLENLAAMANATLTSWRHLRERTGAGGPLKVGSGLDTFLNHAEHVARISAYLAPTTNVHAILGRPAVQQAIRARVGDIGYKRIVASVVGQTVRFADRGQGDRILRDRLRKGSSSVLALRLTTILMQPAGLAVSAGYQNRGFRHLARASRAPFSGAEKKRIEEMALKHSPYWRSRYDNFTSQAQSGMDEQRFSYGGPSLEERGLAAIEWADRMSSFVRWRMAEMQVQRNRPELEQDSAAYGEAVAREWERLVFRGENTSHGGEMSGALAYGRENTWFGAFVRFMSSVSKLYSLAMRGYLQWERGEYKAAARSFAAVTASIAYVAIIRELWAALRGDDDDREVPVRVASRMAQEAASALPIVGPAVVAPLLRELSGQNAYIFPASMTEDAIQGAGNATIALAQAIEAGIEGNPDDFKRHGGRAFLGLLELGALWTGAPFSGPREVLRVVDAQMRNEDPRPERPERRPTRPERPAVSSRP